MKNTILELNHGVVDDAFPFDQAVRSAAKRSNEVVVVVHTIIGVGQYSGIFSLCGKVGFDFGLSL